MFFVAFSRDTFWIFLLQYEPEEPVSWQAKKISPENFLKWSQMYWGFYNILIYKNWIKEQDSQVPGNYSSKCNNGFTYLHQKLNSIFRITQAIVWPRIFTQHFISKKIKRTLLGTRLNWRQEYGSFRISSFCPTTIY